MGHFRVINSLYQDPFDQVSTRVQIPFPCHVFPYFEKANHYAEFPTKGRDRNSMHMPDTRLGRPWPFLNSRWTLTPKCWGQHRKSTTKNNKEPLIMIRGIQTTVTPQVRSSCPSSAPQEPELRFPSRVHSLPPSSVRANNIATQRIRSVVN